MAKKKAKAKVKITAKPTVKKKKPTLGKGSGGMLSARIVAEVKKKKQNG